MWSLVNLSAISALPAFLLASTVNALRKSDTVLGPVGPQFQVAVAGGIGWPLIRRRSERTVSAWAPPRNPSPDARPGPSQTQDPASSECKPRPRDYPRLGASTSETALRPP